MNNYYSSCKMKYEDNCILSFTYILSFMYSSVPSLLNNSYLEFLFLHIILITEQLVATYKYTQNAHLTIWLHRIYSLLNWAFLNWRISKLKCSINLKFVEHSLIENSFHISDKLQSKHKSTNNIVKKLILN